MMRTEDEFQEVNKLWATLAEGLAKYAQKLQDRLDEQTRLAEAWKSVAAHHYREASRLAEEAGWAAFGDSAGSGVQVEFSESTDEAGMPYWERPVKP